jgi:hypothetical protein
MSRGKKIGVVLILAGLCIPILSMLFAEGYDSRQDLIWNIQEMEIYVGKQTIPVKYEMVGTVQYDPSSAEQFLRIEGDCKNDTQRLLKRVNIPNYDTYALFPADLPQAEMERALRMKFPPKVERYYSPVRNFFALGIFLAATGIGLVVCSPKR